MGAVALGLIVSSAAWAQNGSLLSYVPLEHWSYPAFDRLASLGIMPFHALSARPITRYEARRLVEDAWLRLQQAPPAVARLAQDDLQRLRREFSTETTFEARVGGTTGGSGVEFAPPPSVGISSFTIEYALARFLISGRLAADSPAGVPRSELYASFQLGAVQVQLGKAPTSWGPSMRSGLLLSDNSGTMPLFRVSAEIPRARLTKVVASLGRASSSPPGDVVLFGTRLDWAVTPGFRLGLSESVITLWGAPLNFYHLLQPLPVFSGIVASYDLHDAVGQVRNTAVGIDFDWLYRPGVRLYGELLIDDAPGISWPAKIGALAGLHLVDPFRTGKTDLRLEYSFVTNGTYSYGDGSLNHAYLGRSLGHWLGPDGDDLYLELRHRLNPSTTLQLSYALTRHGQGRIGLPPGGPQDWLLSGVVERRQTVGFQLHRIQSPSLETRYRLELASVTNRGNVPGVQATDVLLGVDFTYRWPVVESPSVLDRSTPFAGRSPAPAVSLTDPGRLTFRTWAPTVTSRGALPGPSVSAGSLAVGYRAPLGTTVLSLAYDAAGGSHTFWSADLRHAVGRFAHGSVSVLAGWGGFQFSGDLGGVSRTIQTSGPRLGWDFYYRIAVDDSVTPFYLTGDIAYGFWSTREPAGSVPFYLWTYGLGAGWNVGSGVGLEAGYRGAAAVWQAGTGNATTLRWDGLYLGVSLR